MRLWMSGVELGVYMFAGYAMQAIGLQYTSASRSAFLLYLNVKLVPMFELSPSRLINPLIDQLKACSLFRCRCRY